MADLVSKLQKYLQDIKLNGKIDPVTNQINQKWDTREATNMINNQIQILAQYRQDSVCSPELSTLMNNSLHNMDASKISELVRTQFYNPDVMKSMSCLVTSLLDDELGYIEMLKTSEVLKLVNKDNMIIFFSNFFKGNNKVLTFKYDSDEIIHEGFIGLMVCNKIREVLPTFTWTYGFTSCNLPIFTNEGGKDIILTACQKPVKQMNKDYIGLISEYIKGVTLGKYIKSPQINEKSLVSTLLTVLYSLKYANQMFSYTHWDLHTDNIMMRELDTNDNYIYLPNENKYLWVGNKLATIIDYGFNAARYENTIYGTLRPDLGINPYITKSPLNDVFKLFIHIYKNLLEYYWEDRSDLQRKNVVKKFQKIYFELVGAKDVNELVDFNYLMLKNYAIFPNQRTSSYQATDDITVVRFFTKGYIKLIEDLEALFPDLMTTQKPVNVLSCVDGNCLSENQILDETFSGLTSETSLKQIIPELIYNKKDADILKQILTVYLDDVFQMTQSYQNLPANNSQEMIYVFNNLRQAEEILNKIAKIGEDNYMLNDIYKRTYTQRQELKKQIKRLSNIASDYLILHSSDFDKKTKVPNNQKYKQKLLFSELFRALKSKVDKSSWEIKPPQEEPEEEEPEEGEISKEKADLKRRRLASKPFVSIDLTNET
jgi:hypothetical protein